MSMSLSRRAFLGTAGAVAGLGDFSFLGSLPVFADERPATVELTADLEPLVRLVEDTPREKLIEVVAEKVRAGTAYGELLAAALLAGVRGIKPRPVGFQFHAVLVVHSAHQASLAATDQDRWLPLFWAIDNFKESQAVNQRQHAGWRMPPLDSSRVPAPSKARQAFIDAMDNWDEEAADRAVAGLARSASAGEICELFWRYGCRDFRDIGHKAIYVANATRTLNTIGWRHSEPVLRSLASALLEHEGDNPAKRDADADRPFRENMGRLKEIPEDWRDGTLAAQATTDLLATLRKANPSEAAQAVVALLKKKTHPQAIWDGLFLCASECLYRQPGIVGLHCVTTANALYQAYRTTSSDETRRLAMLQAASFLVMFREAMLKRGKVSEAKLDEVPTVALQARPWTVEDVFAAAGKDREGAVARAAIVLGTTGTQAGALMATARRLIFAKGTNSHDYKFSSAILEDYGHVSPQWRNLYLAGGMVQLRGTGEADNKLIERTRAALSKT